MAVATMVPPRFRSVPLHTSSLGQDAVDLAGYAGLDLDGWQREVLIGAMGRTDADRWAAMEVGVVVPRQNGKGGILEARQLAGLFLVPTDVVQTHTAHRFDTCLDHFRRVRALIEDTPDLLALVKDNGRGVGDTPSGIKDSNGKESIELANGKRLLFKARSKGSGRGFSGDAVYFDEAFWLLEMASLIPSLSARKDPQIWYTSSAPLPRMESDVLRRLVRRGRSGDGRLFYNEWSAPDDADPDDWEAVAAVNPGTEVDRITPEFTAIERAAMTDEEYRRERMGIFPESDDAPQWLVIPEDAWSDTGRGVDGAGWISAPTFAVEVEPDDTGAVIVAAGPVDGGEGVELAVRRDGTGWLVDRLAEMVAKHAPGRPVFVDKGSAADTFTERFEAAGLSVVRVETADVVQAAADIVRGVNAGTVLHRDDDDQSGLSEAVARLVKRSYGDVWLWDRRTGAVVLPFLAASLALWGSRQDADEVAVAAVWT